MKEDLILITEDLTSKKFVTDSIESISSSARLMAELNTTCHITLTLQHYRASYTVYSLLESTFS